MSEPEKRYRVTWRAKGLIVADSSPQTWPQVLALIAKTDTAIWDSISITETGSR